MEKVIVVVDGAGKVVATQIKVSAPLGAKNFYRPQLKAGAGQRIVEIEIEIPKDFESPANLKRFHDAIEKQLP